jgi:hypothetical protein
MSNEELEKIARQAARHAVKETLLSLGIDMENPLEMQEDFAWLRRYRQMAEKVGNRMIATVIVILTGGFIAAMWTGFKSKLGN